MDVHPIEPPVRLDIERRLNEVEAQHAVRILYAHALPWYLQVSPARDGIELPISALLDINGWELRKAWAC